MSVPFIAYGNDELEYQPTVHAGDEILCERCGEKHVLFCGVDANGKPSEMILAVHCGGKIYLEAVNNKRIKLKR